MSANVTIPRFSVPRGRHAMSDLEQIKKNERDRKKRLRLKQVRQQSREISSQVLERAKNIERNELNKIKKRVKDQKLMKIHQCYQEAMEDIGHAHKLAAQRQIDMENYQKSKELEMRRNREMAQQRGKEALQLLKETSKKETEQAMQQERRRIVRETENERAAMVAQLPKKCLVHDEDSSDLSEDEEVTLKQSSEENLAKKSQVKKSISKKSPMRVISKPNSKPVTIRAKPKINVTTAMIHGDNERSASSVPATATSCRPSNTNEQKKSCDMSSNATTCASKPHLSPGVDDICTLDSNDVEPRKSVPVSQATKTLPEKMAGYNPADYKQSSSETSSTTGNSLDSISDDSSYFTDNGPEICDPARRTRTSFKVQFYNHLNRQRNGCDRPARTVEHIDVKDIPTTEDLAQDLAKVEEERKALFEKQKQKEKQAPRNEDAILREKTRRDYAALIRNLDEHERQERKWKAKQLTKSASANLSIPPTRRKELLAQRQRKMNRTFESIQRFEPTERPITITPHDDSQNSAIGTRWVEPPLFDNTEQCSDKSSDEESEATKVTKLYDMLQSVNRQKRKIMKELGANLPESILNIVSRSGCCDLPRERKVCCNATAKPDSPQVTVIDMCNKDVPATEKKETAVQASTTAIDKGVQVRIARSAGKTNRSRSQMIESRSEIQATEDRPRVQVTEGQSRAQPIVDRSTAEPCTRDPVVHIIATGNADNSSSSMCSGSYTSSDGTDVMINVAEQQITVIPAKDRESGLKVTKTSEKRNNSPVRIAIEKESRDGSTAVVSSLVIDTERNEIRVLPKKTISKKDTASATKSTSLSRVSSLSRKPKSSKSSRVLEECPPPRPAQPMKKVPTSPKKTDVGLQATPPVSIDSKQEASDASTTYKSPPILKADPAPRKMNNSTPILELLDSSANETAKSKPRVEVSPVSTPETPSPRTMRVPSNVRRDRRMLHFTPNSTVETPSKGDKRVTTRTDRPTTLVESRTKPESVPSTQATRKEKCGCKSSVCKHTHPNLFEIQAFVAQNAPDVMKDMVDCTKRISSLNDFLQYVRSEKVNSEAAFERNDGVRKLMESIEAIRKQLQKTLFESQEIIAGKGVTFPKPPVPYSKIEMSPRISGEISKDFLAESLPEDNENEIKADENAIVGRPSQKPKIISEEFVHVPLERIRMLKAQTAMQEAALETTSTDNGEEIVKILSNEILEQSKMAENCGFMKSVEAVTRGTSPRNDEELNKQDGDLSSSEKTISNFIPLLAGIPKITQVRTRTHSKDDSKPPASLVNHFGFESHYAHELSAITEFDTPDTGAKSQASARSPTKSNRQLEFHTRSMNVSSRKTDDKEMKLNVDKQCETSPITPRTRGRTSEIHGSKKTFNSNVSTESMHTLPDVPEDEISDIQSEKGPAAKNKFTSTSSTSFSSWSGISEITSSTSTDIRQIVASSPDVEMDKVLQTISSWMVTTYKKTQQASALSSSSNSDETRANKTRLAPTLTRHLNSLGIMDISDISSISMKNTNRSTERSLLKHGRTSTPVHRDANDTNNERSTSTNSLNFSTQERSESFALTNTSASPKKNTRNKDNS